MRNAVLEEFEIGARRRGRLQKEVCCRTLGSETGGLYLEERKEKGSLKDTYLLSWPVCPVGFQGILFSILPTFLTLCTFATAFVFSRKLFL